MFITILSLHLPYSFAYAQKDNALSSCFSFSPPITFKSLPSFQTVTLEMIANKEEAESEEEGIYHRYLTINLD